MIKTTFITLQITTIVMFCTGCGTILARTGEPPSPLYPATSFDLTMIRTGGMFWQAGDCAMATFGWTIVVPLYLVDIPISLTVDTVLLPIDLKQRGVVKERRSREFDLSPHEFYETVPEVILVSVVADPPKEAHATFELVSSGEYVTVTNGFLLKCPATKNVYKVFHIARQYVRVRKLTGDEMATEGISVIP
jgi:uncharacterized protein YceK